MFLFTIVIQSRSATLLLGMVGILGKHKALNKAAGILLTDVDTHTL